MSTGKLSQRRLFKPVFGIPSIYLRKLNSWQDACILAVIALIGLLGSIYLFKSTQAGQFFDRFDRREVLLKEQQNLNAVAVHDYECAAPCTVTGIPVAGETMEFKLNSFRKDATYIVDFGDGRKETIDRDHFRYAYTSPGKYEIKLEVNFQGQSRTLYAEQIEIGSD